MVQFSNKCKVAPHLYVGQAILLKEVDIDVLNYYDLEVEIVYFENGGEDSDDLNMICCCLDKRKDGIGNWGPADFREYYSDDEGFEILMRHLENFAGRRFFWASSYHAIPSNTLDAVLFNLNKELK